MDLLQPAYMAQLRMALYTRSMDHSAAVLVMYSSEITSKNYTNNEFSAKKDIKYTSNGGGITEVMAQILKLSQKSNNNAVCECIVA
ncbi:hypothetical protein Y032_0118g730 [Ancylostoma ceylanicum]|uniref:Uncharacterized protein n=1 Tax=Ancylostoma ceylanicum TaxID=53326 RepID=A0A016TBJ5_9BILA|nr:hypothetical protein Y032_0118g730 [Ancylostoma ceylanicum]